MGIVVCILAAILGYRGFLFLVKVLMLWLVFYELLRVCPNMTYGKIVDIETEKDEEGNLMRIPVIQYQTNEEEVTISNNYFRDEVLNYNKLSCMLNIKECAHVGDKVTVWYNPNNVKEIFLQRPSFALFMASKFIFGCVYLLAAILGVYAVFC